MRNETKLKIIGWLTVTTIALQAACPKPTDTGLCGWSSQVEHPSNGCCRIDGPGQIQEKRCLGDGASYQCVEVPRKFYYYFQSWVVDYNVSPPRCDYEHYTIPPCGISDFGWTPYTAEVYCPTARLDTSVPCDDDTE
ncbi:MAG: hypothetical protein J7M06_05045 [Proteobacteria bacterium]|nr:hypothetical protein [Pseudomonadota bacterium]